MIIVGVGQDDFDGLMQKAAAAIALGKTVFCRKSGTGNLKRLRYVFIDEYQDFSELFHRLIKAVREQNPQEQMIKLRHKKAFYLVPSP